jgi:hypothetical protein
VDGRYEGKLDKDKVNRLKKEISPICAEIVSLEGSSEVVEMRARQEERDELLERKKMHQSMIDLSRLAPADSLKSAVILSSTEICIDGEAFKNKVNRYFDLNIEMQHV